MDFLDLLPPEHVVVPLRAPDLRGAIMVLARRLHESGVVEDLEALEARIREQPVRDVVGITPEVVLPHYRSDAVNTLGLALGVAPEPIAAGEDGGLAVRVVALILAPPDAATLYLQATSTLARLFRQTGIVDEMARQPDATVRRTLDLMLRRKTHAIPVVGEKGEVLGMVTDSDIMRALLPKIPRAGQEETGDDEPQDQPVRDIMTRSVLCVSEDLGVGEVASMMINKNVEQVPVVNAGSIAGMVYRGDIIRKLFGRA